MHVYAADEDRRVVTIILAGLSLICAYGLSRLVSQTGLTWLWWVDMPAPIGFYALFHKLFNERLWSCRWVRRLGLSKVPNLIGEWHAEMRSSYDEFKTLYVADAVITQTWTSISITLNRDSSHSHSISASLTVNATAKATLSYLYVNQPKPESVDTMSIHYGTAVVQLNEDGNVLEGSYYTGRGRSTFGSLILTRRVDTPVTTGPVESISESSW